MVKRAMKIVYRLHAIKRMFRRNISQEDVRRVIEAGEIIENYPEDLPYPSRLVLEWGGSRPIHVVVAENRTDEELIVITAYEPDPDQWEEGFRRRKK